MIFIKRTDDNIAIPVASCSSSEYLTRGGSIGVGGGGAKGIKGEG